jgi:arabinose-5-phosphate isomerase
MNTKAKVSYLDSIKEVLEIEANAILALKKQVGKEFNDTIEMILSCKSRVIISGMGKSGLIGKKIVATLASTGTPSLFLHPAEGLHGDLGMVTKNDVVIAISNSGETDEILKIIPSLKRIGAKMIALVGNKNSTLAEKSDIVLSIGKVEEACPLGLAPTTSTIITMAIGDAIAVALLKARQFKPENFALFHPGGSLGRKLLLTIKDIITDLGKNPVISSNVSVKDCLFEMTRSGLGAISIIDEKGTLKGIVTDGDIRRALTKGNYILESTVEELFNANPTFITEELLAAEALRIMEENRINVLPVVNESNCPIAMVHIHDLTRLGL